MRLYNASSCTPSTVLSSPRVGPPLQHFLPPKTTRFLPPRDLLQPTPADQCRKSIPDVAKSATNTTADSSSPTDQTLPVLPISPMANKESVASFSAATSKESLNALSQRFSSESFLFDIDVVKSSEKNGSRYDELGDMYSKDSSSTMSTHASQKGQSTGRVNHSSVVHSLDPSRENRGSTPISQASAVATWTTPNFEKVVISESASFHRLLANRRTPVSDATDGWLVFDNEAFQPIERHAVEPQAASLVVQNPTARQPNESTKKALTPPWQKSSSIERRVLDITQSISQESSQMEDFPEAVEEDWDNTGTAQSPGVIELTEMRSSTSTTPGNWNDDEELLDRIQSDPNCSLYQSMLDDGVPLSLVRVEMKNDGLLHEDFEFQVPANSHSSEGTGSRDKAEDSIWAAIEMKDMDWLRSISLDSHELDTLFGKKADAEEVSPRGLRVIEPNRANQCDCLLAGIKLSHREIVAAITDIHHDELTLEQTEGLLKFLPTVVEARALKSHLEITREPFSVECEQYMSEVMHVPGAEAKLKAMIFMKRFPLCVDSVMKDCLSLRSGCKGIQTSESLRQVLALILHLGNVINSIGGELETAKSFSLGSLLQVEVANDGCTSFLEYAAKVMMNVKPTLSSLPPPVPVQAWSQSQSEFYALDEQLLDLRSLALAISSAKKSLSVDEEATVLKRTEVGQFVLSSYRTTAVVYGEMDSTRRVVERTCQYFGESAEEGENFLRDVNDFLFHFEEAMERVGTTRVTVEHHLSHLKRKDASSTVSI